MIKLNYSSINISSMMILAGLAFAPQSQAAGIVFTSAGIICSNSANAAACGAGVNNIWNTGDFLQQTFTLPGLTSVDQLTLNLTLFNVLDAGQNETLSVLVNSVTVGSFGFTGSGLNIVNQVFNFAPIAGAGGGTDYTVRFNVAAPGVPTGNGTLGLPTGSGNQTGDLSLSGVPEPATISLAAMGLLGLIVGARRSRSRSVPV